MKKLIIGIAIGSTLTLSTQVFADSIQRVITKVTYPILINGKEFKSDTEALNIDGNTYLPLKDIGTALNTNVKWNDALKRVEIGDQIAELTPEQKAEQNLKMLNEKTQKFYAEYKAKGIELINYDRFASFMSARSMSMTQDSSKYSFNRYGKYSDDGKTWKSYVLYKGEHEYTRGVELIEAPSDIPAWMGSTYVDLAFLKKFISQNIIDEYFQAIKDKSWGMGAFRNDIP